MQYDLLIIGGGMVGASLACALRNTSLKVGLIDATALQAQDDPRLIALHHGSYQLFENLGIWQDLAEQAAAINEVHVSDKGHFGKVRLKAKDANVSVLGYVVPAKHINVALNNAISQHIDVFRPAKLKYLTQDHTTVKVIIETENGDINLESNWVIGADGTHSTVRDLLGIPSKTLPIEQHAIVTIVDLNQAHAQIAYERFQNRGAIAMLPLTGLRAACIWTDENATIESLMQLPDDLFLNELQKHFGYKLGRLQKINKRYQFPLHRIDVAQTIKDRVILLGNAAHTLYPIAAQGLNLALSEIAMLAQCFIDNEKQPNLSSYIAWQQKLTTNSTRLSHQLPSLFSHDFTLVNIARQLGMVGLNLCPPLKRRFAQHAMGKIGNLPRLLLEKGY